MHTYAQPHACAATHGHAHVHSPTATHAHRTVTCMHTQSQPHSGPDRATHMHSHTHRCAWQRPHPPTRVQPCTRMCSSCPWQGPAEGSSPSKGTPGLGSVGPGQRGCRGMPAVQQGGHRCSGKWHPRGLSLACDRPCSGQRRHHSGVPAFAVSASAGACVKGWRGGDWWHMVFCPAWVTGPHTHTQVQRAVHTHVCSHSQLLPCSVGHGVTHLCVCVAGAHVAPLQRGCRHASCTGNMHEHT